MEDKGTDIISIRKLLDKYGEHTLSELLKDVKGRYELALQMYNSFCKEEDDAVKAIGEKYSQSECLDFIATGYSMLGLAILYQQDARQEYGAPDKKQRGDCKCLAKKQILGTKPGRCPHGCLYCFWKDPVTAP